MKIEHLSYYRFDILQHAVYWNDESSAKKALDVIERAFSETHINAAFGDSLTNEYINFFGWKCSDLKI